MSRNHRHQRLKIPLAILGLSCCHFGLAADECRVEYGYHSGSGANRTNNVERVYLSVGQTRRLNQSNLNYIKNLRANKARFNLEGSNSVALDQNAVNPAAAFYLTPVTLVSVQCLNQHNASFDNPEALINALKRDNNTAQQVAQGLKDTFNLNGQQIANLLKGANFNSGDIAQAMKETFNASPRQIAAWLKAAGYSGQQVVAALQSGLNTNAKTAAGLAKNLFNGSVSQVAQWLRSSGYSLAQTTEALTDIETEAQKVMQALKNSFNLTADQLVNALKQQQKIITPQSCSVSGCRQVAQYLKNIGYALNDVLKALLTHFDISVQAAHDIGKNVYRSGNAALEQALAFAGYSAQQIANAVE